MDQDAFRNLLDSSQRSQSNGKRAVPVTANTLIPKVKSIPSSQPAFKPRNVKKTESKYRDRAAERRDGTGNDYAEVEAVLEDFERRAAHQDKDVVEQQRKYLGGDSQHTILVKGLDMSLLEQNRARAAASTEDDEVLEQAFVEATGPTEPRNRTREDIIRDLKAKRQNGDKPSNQPVSGKPVEEENVTLETAKKAGRFKPIGFKPIGQTEENSRKRKTRDGKEGVRKKKKKGERVPVESGAEKRATSEMPPVSPERDITEASSSKIPLKTPEPEAAPLDEDFDIFAGAGDYEGFPIDEDSEEEKWGTEGMKEESTAQAAASAVPVANDNGWFNEPKLEARPASNLLEKSPPILEMTGEEPEETRLMPLESSALPSIRDFLAMDEAVEKAEKRKARKEKKKKKKKGDDDDG